LRGLVEDAGNDPTAEHQVPRWNEDIPAARSMLRFSVAWWGDAPERVGESFGVPERRIFGRAPSDESAVLERWRPLGAKPAPPPVRTSTLSRQQLELVPEGTDAVRVRNLGRRPLLYRGREVDECLARPGDVLQIQDVAVFVVDSWPLANHHGGLRPHGREDFPFGHADVDGMVGESRGAWELRAQIALAATGDRHVLIQGESGAGKEVAARALHRASRRRSGPFVSRSAATFTEGLLEAELFGTMRGFPDARSPDRPGLVGAAAGGTLFLDEIAELPEGLQAPLLRVLDPGGEYQRLGEQENRHSDFSFIGATNRDASALKSDLLARLSVRLRIPPLRERRADIPLIAMHLLRRGLDAGDTEIARFCEDGDPRRARFHPELVAALLEHDYAVNTRELEQLLILATRTSPGQYLRLTEEVAATLGLVTDEHPVQHGPDLRPSDPSDPLRDDLLQALQANDYNVSATARQLDISRDRFRRLMTKYGIERTGT
jgi:DNA-binding NtrC family response regulator